MGFSLFSKDKNASSNSAKASIFGKLRNNAKAAQNKSRSHNFDSNEPSFGQENFGSYTNGQPVSTEYQKYGNLDPNSVNEKTLAQAAQVSSNPTDLASTNLNGQAPQAMHEDIDAQSKYYTYPTDESYLDEAGRNADHLYIGPGEPLTPKKARVNPHMQSQVAPASVEDPSKKELFATQNTIVRANPTSNVHIPEPTVAPVSQVAPKEDSGPKYITPGTRTSSVPQPVEPVEEPQSSGPVYITPGSQSQKQAEAIKEVAPVEKVEDGPIYITPGQVAPAFKAAEPMPENVNKQNSKPQSLEEVFAQVAAAKESAVQTATSATTPSAFTPDVSKPNLASRLDTPDENLAKVEKENIFAQVKRNDINVNTPKQSDNVPEISCGVNIFLFIRQIFAAFFNFTNLGIIFERSATNWLGPSKPAFMPIPYFVIGFICSLAALSLKDILSMNLCSQILFISLIIFVGCDGFRGCGKLLSTFTQRKLDTYVQAVLVLIFATTFVSTFQYFVTESGTHAIVDYACAFATLMMLSSICGASICFGSSDDPVSSYGSLGLVGLIFSSILCAAVAFVILDWSVALSMIGICVLVRIVLGQFMYLKGISASCDVVCAVRAITVILLMIDLLFLSRSGDFMNVKIFN